MNTDKEVFEVKITWKCRGKEIVVGGAGHINDFELLWKDGILAGKVDNFLVAKEMSKNLEMVLGE